MPRIETTRTLAARSGRRPQPRVGQISLRCGARSADARAAAARAVLGRGLGARDPRGFEQARRVAGRRPRRRWRAPRRAATRAARGLWERCARRCCAGGSGPGATRARCWRRSPSNGRGRGRAPHTDALFDLHAGRLDRASQAGGRRCADAERCSRAAARAVPASSTPTRSDGAVRAARRRCRRGAALRGLRGRGPAQRPRQVLDAPRPRRAPVALIAQDRLLVRRVRALLERASTCRCRRDRLEAVDHARRRARDGAAARGASGAASRRCGSTGSRPTAAARARIGARSMRSRPRCAARWRAARRSTRRGSSRRRGAVAAAADCSRRCAAAPRAASRPGWRRCATRSRLRRAGPLRNDDAGRQVLAALASRPSRHAARRHASTTSRRLDARRVQRAGSTPRSRTATFVCPTPRDARARRSSSRRWRARCCGRSPPSCCPAPTSSGSARAPAPIRCSAMRSPRALGLPDAAQRRAAERSPSRSCCARRG